MSEINVISYTNPIPAETLVPQPFTYPSGGAGGGGITKGEMADLLTAFMVALVGNFGTQLDTIIALLQDLPATLQHLSDNSDNILADTNQIRNDSGTLVAWQVKSSDFSAAVSTIEADIVAINTLVTTLTVPTMNRNAADIINKLGNIGGTVNAHIV